MRSQYASFRRLDAADDEIVIAEQSLTTITSIKALIHNILNVKLLSADKIACQVQYLVDEDVDPSLNDLGKEAL